MKEVSWSKLVGQIFEEGVRLASELEKEMVKHTEQAKPKTEESKAPVAPKAQPVVGDSFLQYIATNLAFQGYEILQDRVPNLIHVHANGNPVAYLIFGVGNQIIIQPAVSDVQTKPMEATLYVERIKEELSTALQAKCSNEIIMKTALELTDAFVAESVANEDAKEFDKLVQTLNSLLATTQGVH